MSRKVEKLLNVWQQKQSQRRWDRDMMNASPSLRNEYFAMVRQLDNDH